MTGAESAVVERAAAATTDAPWIDRFGAAALANVRAVLASGQLSGARGRGLFNAAFESEARRLLDMPFALTFSSATAAMVAALQALGVSRGDDVVVDPLVKFGAVAALHCGATPVFADVDPETFVVSPSSIEHRLTSRTAAIVCTALYGLMPPLERIVALAAARGIPVVEDCAQAILAARLGRPAGTWGDAGVFSFQATKHLSTGEGGLLVTRSAATHGASQAIRDHGWRADDGHADRILPHNYRMAELVAAVGVAQMPIVNRVVAYHGELAALFTAAVADVRWIRPQHVDGETTRHAYWMWTARLLDADRGPALVARLAASGSRFKLGCYPGGPAYLRPLFRHVGSGDFAFARGLCPSAEALAESVLTIRLDCAEPRRVFEAEAERLAALAKSV
jgi:perosamine synthetase